uniref:HSF-type DNA-binding domain-containing protein n=1 Tax=Diacronema lutheri TaxID=2081491 RepID=A0A7R9YLY0_DIALT|mmetsp:Transcript_4547/g.14019  ORF Transcript_4547/g.14019 Transcript_4547/m.14019 type:complete len:290 (+) Transcript_4547:149-1018(+)
MPPDAGPPTMAGDGMYPAPFDPDTRKVPMPHADRIPPFLCKLYQIVHTPDTDHCICWSPTRDSLLIVDQAIFAKQILPLYFKHNSIRSFIRQLNTYGFRKRTRAEHTEFHNPAFKADHMEMLLQIKRVGAKQESVGDDDESSGSESAAQRAELVSIDVQVHELRRELKDMRSVMQQYLQQLDFKIAMQTHLARTGAAAAAVAAPADLSAADNEAAWAAYLNALTPAKADPAELPMQQAMDQAHEMHLTAQQEHLQQLQQHQQLQQAQQLQLLQQQQQQQHFMQTEQAAG